MAGISLGGYYAPRAAAFDKRIKACLALGGPYDWGECMGRRARPHARGVPRAQQERHASRRRAARPRRCRSRASRSNITCPIYIMNGKLDRIVPAKDSERLAREVKGPVVLNLIEDGNHIANNRAYRWRTQSADWMAEQLGAG